MLSSLIAWVLNNYLGKYVENLNTDQLSIALLKGCVELENLPLRKDALRHVGLPIDIKSGFIGKVTLQVPFTRIRSAPWLISIENLIVVLGPLNLEHWDEDVEEQASNEYKMSLLRAMEVCWRSATSSEEENYYGASNSWFDYGSSMVTSIVENIRLEIKNVHLRYEDASSAPGETFAAGLMVESLSVKSCEPFESREEGKGNFSYQMASLTGAAVYWDANIGEQATWKNYALIDLIEKCSVNVCEDRSFVIPSVYAKARIQRDRRLEPLRSKTQARLVCNLELDSLCVHLNDVQYGQMIACLKNLKTIQSRKKRIKYRPSKAVFDDPKAWWKYAARCGTSEECGVYCTLQESVKLASENVAYVKAYVQTLSSPSGESTLSEDVLELKRKVEWERSFNDLRVLREIAMRKVRKPVRAESAEKKVNSASGTLSLWFPQWWGWYSATEEQPMPEHEVGTEAEKGEEQTDENMDKIENEILDWLADTMDNNTILKRDTVFGRFHFQLKKAVICLHGCVLCDPSQTKCISELIFGNVKLEVESRPRTSSSRVTVSLHSITLNDRSTENSVFPTLISPQVDDTAPINGKSALDNYATKYSGKRSCPSEPLLQLSYECKPFNTHHDYVVHVTSRSLDVVYNAEATRRLADFFARPSRLADAELRRSARRRIDALKNTTKKKLLKNWDDIMSGDACGNRKRLDIKFDISAPRIFLVENFTDPSAVVCVVDLGKFRFRNISAIEPQDELLRRVSDSTGSEQDEEFATPCSTPPGSAGSAEDDCSSVGRGEESNGRKKFSSFSESTFCGKIYEKYLAEFGDLQIMVGKMKENGSLATLKGASSTHVLDKFNVALAVERRIVQTDDPQFPSLRLFGNLPKLVVHANEQKLNALRSLYHSFCTHSLTTQDSFNKDMPLEESSSNNIHVANGKHEGGIIDVRFMMDELCVEIQSRGRCIAELQMSGITTTVTRNMISNCAHLTLGVNSLLLVDALQTFGPDFELLLASHKHVGMDSLSGSLRDSEPTSPLSRGSIENVSVVAPSANTLSQALNSLQTCGESFGVSDLKESLIYIEISTNLLTESRKACVKFNNLDVVANQETIVELISFANRMFPPRQPASTPAAPFPSEDKTSWPQMAAGLSELRLEFDFQRLSVLLLRTISSDRIAPLAKKIATATVTRASVHATLGQELRVDGWLGGLHVLDVTSGVAIHRKILSIGQSHLDAPATQSNANYRLFQHLSSDLYNIGEAKVTGSRVSQGQAFNFSVRHTLDNLEECRTAAVKVSFSSAIYTHSAEFLIELSLCATEFKRYLKNLAKSIGNVATEIAVGLVQARTEALARTFNNRFSDFDSNRWLPSPVVESGTGTPFGCYTPLTPTDIAGETFSMKILFDATIDTPILVCPASAESYDVLVAHLGRITINNHESDGVRGENTDEYGLRSPGSEIYEVKVRDMSLHSLNVKDGFERFGDSGAWTADRMYDCETDGKPILHDTALSISVEMRGSEQTSNDTQLSMQEECLAEPEDLVASIDVSAEVITPLKLSVSRAQYEQLWRTAEAVISGSEKSDVVDSSLATPTDMMLAHIEQGRPTRSDVSALDLDPALRARMLRVARRKSSLFERSVPFASFVKTDVSFHIPIFTMELRADLGDGEKGLIDLSFREFTTHYRKMSSSETKIEVGLESFLIEDLQRDANSKHRYMMVSYVDEALNMNASCSHLSTSCPDLSENLLDYTNTVRSSLPDYLQTESPFATNKSFEREKRRSRKSAGDEYPDTPPPSPQPGSVSEGELNNNLVRVDVTLYGPQAAQFRRDKIYKSVKVDLNSLNIVANAESWAVVLDFFGLGVEEEDENVASCGGSSSRPPSQMRNVRAPSIAISQSSADCIQKWEMELVVRSLSVVLNKREYEVARASVQKLNARIVRSHNVPELGDITDIEGCVGCTSLHDLSPAHGKLYDHRFVTSQLEFSIKRFSKPDKLCARDFDVLVRIEMPSITYVHTQRFFFELLAFFNNFLQLQRVLAKIRKRVSPLDDDDNNWPTRAKLEVYASLPVIVLPVSSQHADALIFDLGCLSVTNSFKWTCGDECETTRDTELCLLDVIEANLSRLDAHTGRWCAASGMEMEDCESDDGRCIALGNSYAVRKCGPSLLRDKCQLNVTVERNLLSHLTKIVPDTNAKGVLRKLAVAIDLDQYKLIRGLLAYNIGECLDDLSLRHGLPSEWLKDPPFQCNGAKLFWTTSSLDLQLLDVSVTLLRNRVRPSDTANAIARFNFARSQLTVESFSDHSQEVDLISQRLLVSDERYTHLPESERPNAFTDVLRPLSTCGEDIRVEVHHRKKADGSSSYTILLNNTRVMAILDWWTAVADFLNCQFDTSPSSQTCARAHQDDQRGNAFEVKLNVTNSEVVVLEDPSRSDSYALVFKSTTVVNYHPARQPNKILSCNFNRCEVFTCVLGALECDTALSVIDPITISCEISRRKLEENGEEVSEVLSVYAPLVVLRLSYNDVRLFTVILDSLRKQTNGSNSYARYEDECREECLSAAVRKLRNLGFGIEDCEKALRGRNLNEAALWLTEHGTPCSKARDCSPTPTLASVLNAPRFREVTIDCVRLCVIDDCRDSDVPLLEICANGLIAKKDAILARGEVECSLAVDYYNRLLSGWEPIIEPWQSRVTWHRSLTDNLLPEKTVWGVSARDALNVNVTRTLLDLYGAVKATWSDDYYKENEYGDVRRYRQRFPFVPFELLNRTGCHVWYSTCVSADDERISPDENTDCDWLPIGADQSAPFAFNESANRRRGDNRHKTKARRLTVKVQGWQPVTVAVDRVGVYFRYAAPDMTTPESRELPQARVVFDVSMKGTCGKLVVVRSALLLTNHLDSPIEVKLENNSSNTVSTYFMVMGVGQSEPAPLSHTHAQISIRPQVSTNQYYGFCTPPIFWQHVRKANEMVEEWRQCHSNKGSSYKFVAVVRREKYPTETVRRPSSSNRVANIWTHPGHEIAFESALLLENLLPCELRYNTNDVESGVIAPSKCVAMREVSPDYVTEISLSLDNYPGEGNVTIPSPPCSFDTKVKLSDQSGRPLHICASITAQPGSAIKASIYAPYWIVNKTALPLVFKQEGVLSETAGQYAEHEVARMASSLLFSLTDQDASPTVVARLGNACHSDGTPQWCQPFHLHVGVQVRRLRVSLKDRRPDIMYTIGVNVRSGRGRYRNTNVVTIVAHYQIYNRSTHTLLFAQKHLATQVGDPSSEVAYVKALPGSNLPFHWPRQDKERLLCVKMLDIPGCRWSGSFPIKTEAFHLNIRDQAGEMYFLRVEIVLQGAAYMVVLTDGEMMRPPIRVDNASHVALQFHQESCDSHTIVREHSSVAYALDEPTKPPALTLVAPGGDAATYDLTRPGKLSGLTYENFIYIAFSATFAKVETDLMDPLDVQSQQLVLDVPSDSGGRVVLARKERGSRSQLWRMTSDGQLQHEGSSPPMEPGQKKSSRRSPDTILVLDIGGTALQPTEYVNLALRRPSRRRISTQTWRFTEEGRMCCAHNNLCVQARDGFFGLRRLNNAVLGPINSGATSYHAMPNGVPFEQAICRQRLRPGSGFLSVAVVTDGPTRVLQITDPKDKSAHVSRDSLDQERCPSPTYGLDLDENKSASNGEFEVNVDLEHGVGVSLISRKPAEEIAYAKLTKVKIAFARTARFERMAAVVGDIQIDNQLLEAQHGVCFYISKYSQDEGPAIELAYQRVLKPPHTKSNVEIFTELLSRVKSANLILEEKLLLKLCLFFGLDDEQSNELASTEESEYEAYRILDDVVSVRSKRYYLEQLELDVGRLKLSVATSPNLPTQLKSAKKKLGLTLIKFEDASIDIKPLIRRHLFETSRVLLDSIAEHFKVQLKWQAAVILGSVDFLGNPLGFVNDLSEGVSGLIYEGNVGAFVQNVAHGLSNSAAKVTETLSDGIGLITMDHGHQETRHRIRSAPATGGDHLVAGLKGLGFGLLGGVTSVFKQTYEGASQDGVQGFITGLGKGLVGTVTKPVVGMLDLASETASAVRDTSKASRKTAPRRIRRPRCVPGASGLLPPYSAKQSLGQEYLYSLNGRDRNETFQAFETLHGGQPEVNVVVSSEMVRVFTRTSRSNNIVMETHLSDVAVCRPLVLQEMDGHFAYYVEMLVESADGVMRRPRVRCQDENVASWVCERVNHAKSLYVQRLHTLILDDNAEEHF